MIGAGRVRSSRRFIVWGRQNPTDVVSRAGDWIGFGVRRVIGPHSVDPLPEVDPTPQHPEPHPPVEREPGTEIDTEEPVERVERAPSKVGPPAPERRALSLGLDLAAAASGGAVAARAGRGRPRKALG